MFREYKQRQELHCWMIRYFETRRLLAVKVNGYKVVLFFEQVFSRLANQPWDMKTSGTQQIYTLSIYS